MQALQQQYTPDELQRAYDAVRGPAWPPLEQALQDEIHRRQVLYTAWRIAHGFAGHRVQRAPVMRPEPPPFPTHRPAPHDRKRAAAGDRDDDPDPIPDPG